MYSVVNL